MYDAPYYELANSLKDFEYALGLKIACLTSVTRSLRHPAKFPHLAKSPHIQGIKKAPIRKRMRAYAFIEPPVSRTLPIRHLYIIYITVDTGLTYLADINLTFGSCNYGVIFGHPLLIPGLHYPWLAAIFAKCLLSPSTFLSIFVYNSILKCDCQ